MSIEDLSRELAGQGDAARGPAVAAEDVSVFRWSKRLHERVPILEDINLTIRAGEHWSILGPNGAGKTTLLHLAAANSHPSTGTVDVLGKRLGRVDVRALRERIGLVDARTASSIPRKRPALETVESGAFSSIALQHQRLEASHRRRADALLEMVGLGYARERLFDECSQGERQRILLARAVMPNPELLLLDEPASGLDLPSREQLVAAMVAMSSPELGLTTITVTHHLEEIPPTATHAMLMADRRIVAQGRIEQVLTSELVSACFEVPVEVARNNDRWTATLRAAT